MLVPTPAEPLFRWSRLRHNQYESTEMAFKTHR